MSFAGLEVAYSVCAVAAGRGQVASAVDALWEQDSYRPERSVFALRDVGVWRAALARVRAAMATNGGQTLDRWASAALVEAVVRAGPSLELLTVASEFWGERVNDWLTARVAWTASWEGLALAEPFRLAPTLTTQRTPARDSYTESVWDAWDGELQASIVELGSGPLLLAPRIASRPIAAEVHGAAELFEPAEELFQFLAALEHEPHNVSRGGGPLAVSDASLAVMVEHLRSKWRGSAADEARLAEAVAEPAFAARLAAGQADERVAPLLNPVILQHYDDAFEELVYLTIEAVTEEA